MNRTDDKIKHLEFLQLTIIRMAANSFLLKAWGVTLVAAIFALSFNDRTKNYVLIAFLPTLMFWILDGYYLHQEKLFRKLYDKVRKLPESKIDFSLDTSVIKGSVESWPRCIFSTTLNIFYGTIVAVLIVAALVITVRR